VVYADNRSSRDDYVLALEGGMRDFIYSYTRIIDTGFSEEDPQMWIIPEVEVSFDVRAFNRAGELLLDKVYDSGLVAGEGYMTTFRPSARINETLHATLHAVMLQIASDVRPLLIGECEVTGFS
jgi:hypothetical protein